jgi:hypothetical protein
LFDRFRLFDLAIKVVGVGSVGTYCALGLFMAADDDPSFLQVKEARKSVLEPYAGKSLHRNQGERIVAGQRLMQAASDIFLGWTRGVIGRDYYFRQLRDAKISAIPEDWDLRRNSASSAPGRSHGRMRDPATRRGLPATWAPIRRSTTRCASSRSNMPTRTFATIAALSKRSAKIESR